MLKVGDVVSSFFQLVLGIFSKLIPNAINKSLGVLKVFSEKGLELWLRDLNSSLVIMLVLGPFEADNAIEESGVK